MDHLHCALNALFSVKTSEGCNDGIKTLMLITLTDKARVTVCFLFQSVPDSPLKHSKELCSMFACISSSCASIEYSAALPDFSGRQELLLYNCDNLRSAGRADQWALRKLKMTQSRSRGNILNCIWMFVRVTAQGCSWIIRTA